MKFRAAVIYADRAIPKVYNSTNRKFKVYFCARPEALSSGFIVWIELGWTQIRSHLPLEDPSKSLESSGEHWRQIDRTHLYH